MLEIHTPQRLDLKMKSSNYTFSDEGYIGQSQTFTSKILLKGKLLSMRHNIHSQKKIGNNDRNALELHNIL